MFGGDPFTRRVPESVKGSAECRPADYMAAGGAAGAVRPQHGCNNSVFPEVQYINHASVSIYLSTGSNFILTTVAFASGT